MKKIITTIKKGMNDERLKRKEN